jgi:cation diffusion facilitator CzcD-associated flavoprotein CzcO
MTDTQSQATTSNLTADGGATLDAVIIGAGFSGMYMLHKLRDEQGLNVRVIEAGSGVGGTWYHNRYPGARCDSDSYIYCYTFDKEMWQDWHWSERYPEQPEILRYLEHVADRFDFRKDIAFDTRVTGVTYDEATNLWTVATDKGDPLKAHIVIAAVGSLSATNIPSFKGLETFKGKCYHTSQWPKGGVDFTGKRVGVIGTGATAVQAIPVIAQQAKELTVFQRTPNFCVPARNGKVDPEVWAQRKQSFDSIVDRTRNSFFGFELDFIPQSVLEASPEEREATFNKMWDEGGFRFWLGNYQDMFFVKEANDLCADFIKRKIRATVKDPVTAEKLIPKTYAYGTKRQPLDTNYYETFNKDYVHLVDLTEDPIEEITPDGVKTKSGEHPIDILVCATGFDAMTGPLKKLNVAGRGGEKLADRWAHGPTGYLGVAIAGFPNFFTVTGPGSPSVLSNMPTSIEQHVEWIADCITHMRKNGWATIEASAKAEEEWTAHVAAVADTTLMPASDTWYTGANIPGKPRVFMAYLGGVGGYRQKCREIADNGYEGFVTSSDKQAPASSPA